MSNVNLVCSNCYHELCIQATVPALFLNTSLSLIGDTINVIPGQIIASSFKLKIGGDLYCQHCRHKVKPEDVKSTCSVCKEMDSLNNLFVAVPKVEEQTATNLVHKGDCHQNLVNSYSKYFRKEIKIDLHPIKLSLGGEQ